MGSPDFIYGGFTEDNSEGNSYEPPVRFIKRLSLGIFDSTFLYLSDSSKLVE